MKNAYLSGYEDYFLGIGLSANPYSIESQGYDEWARGWLDAQYDDAVIYDEDTTDDGL